MIFKILLSCVLLILFSCEDSGSDASINDSTSDCNELITVDSSRGDCLETLDIANECSITTSGDLRKITANNIPAHDVGLFGNYPRALNPKLLPDQLKQQATYDWNRFIERVETNQHRWLRGDYEEWWNGDCLHRWKKFGGNIINYMNGEDWFEHWQEFIDYMRPQDRYHKTNILDVYPEFQPYWEKNYDYNR